MSGRILSGIQPTGFLHIGNYLGAIKNWVKMQNDYDCLFCVVDLHALTLPQDPKNLRTDILRTAATYIACGIDPKKNGVFVQSHIHEHTELSWLLGCMTPLGWLNRMTQFKEKSAKVRDESGLGLLAYPVLMAADILLYKATHVPVGEDQKQHLELARDLAGAFNRRYETEFFPLPEPQILKSVARIMSLRDGSNKMSKSDTSDYSRINLSDSDDEIVLKIRKAKTDPNPLPSTPDESEDRVEAHNLLRIYAAFCDQPLSSVYGEFAGSQFGPFKAKLAELVCAQIGPIRDQINALMQDEAHLFDVLKMGSDKAKAIAATTMKDVRSLVGLP